MENSLYNLTIDPGIGGTGYALWDASPFTWKSLVYPVDTGILNVTNTSAEWKDRVNEMVNGFVALIQIYKPVITYLEYPKFFGTTAKGYASAATGDVFKLMFLVGALAVSTHFHSLKYELVEVNKWKGQLSKENIANRVARLYCGTPDMYPSHSMDAVGIGLYLKGYLNAG